MTTTKITAKPSPEKRPTPASVVAAAKTRSAPRAKPALTAEPVARTRASPKRAAKAAEAKPTRARSNKAAPVPPDQLRYYVEVAAYHIAERRGFAPGDPLQDWVQAEAEIGRLRAAGLLGG